MKANAFTFAAILAVSCAAQAETAFYYTSSPTSYVGGGETKLISASDGFNFKVVGAAESGIQFVIDNWYPGQPGDQFLAYSLTFTPPTGQFLIPGEYLGAERSPSQPTTHPGLEFAAESRGDNQVQGSFTVYEASFGANAQVLSFAADFVQYDEGNKNWWNIGQIRYNSDIPIIAVPEPTTGMLFALSLLGVVFVARRSKVGHKAVR